jgi:hypothetical protein
MMELNDLLDRVSRKEAPPAAAAAASQQQQLNAGMPGYVAPKQPTKYLTSKLLTRWIDDQKLIALILGKDSHPEMIRRAPPVMKFLAQNKALTKEALDALWVAGIGKHEVAAHFIAFLFMVMFAYASTM